MKANIAKAKGLPFSTSRSQEKKNKHVTQKARRQDGKRQVRGWWNDWTKSYQFATGVQYVCQNTLAK